jgi:hypothetical protein
MTTKVSSSVLASTTVTPGTYGGSTQHAVVTVDQQGRATYAANATPSIATTQLSGTITNAQLAGSITFDKITSVSNSAISGLITSSQIASVSSSAISGLITSSQIASVTNSSIVGTINASQGGTGLTSPGTSGNILTSNGTTWTSATPSQPAQPGTSITAYWINGGVQTAGRAGGTVYQNTSGKTRFVLLAYINVAGNVYVDNVNGSTTVITYMQSGGGAPWNTTFFLVPNGYYYQVPSGGSGGSYYGWTEWQ